MDNGCRADAIRYFFLAVDKTGHFKSRAPSGHADEVLRFSKNLLNILRFVLLPGHMRRMTIAQCPEGDLFIFFHRLGTAHTGKFKIILWPV